MASEGEDDDDVIQLFCCVWKYLFLFFFFGCTQKQKKSEKVAKELSDLLSLSSAHVKGLDKTSGSPTPIQQKRKFSQTFRQNKTSNEIMGNAFFFWNGCDQTWSEIAYRVHII